ncbi:two-component regulator propeller domain-containing protein [Polaribacter cellanae]|uniref:PorZ N-terminal beta-propeller domain-containing protein n=1 Tax=Polaribacter cellanae TaxID=2818493 RepID=A0A975H8P5_9FLAO|nr:two-component regulator propeller domain-containing protein [Polaribacter cellanae]QTE24284.1 hypothetical protein J3359_08495 [Polaribacter cellanae]
MKKRFSIYILLFSIISIYSQTDYSDSWEDFFSYNNVKDFTKVGNTIYALADNAVFTYDAVSGEVNKLSSVQGLSGETTTSIYYSEAYKRLIIGYENGLVEVVDEDGTITISSDIINFNQSGEKSINHISEYNKKLYLSTPFAIVVYDIEKLEFGDTYFIGIGSSSVKINQTAILNDVIYAVTEEGIFSADANSTSLIDFTKWTKQFNGRNFKEIVIFNAEVFVTENSSLLKLGATSLTEVRNFNEDVKNVKASNSHVTVALKNEAVVLNTSLIEEVAFITNTDFNFSLNTAFFENNTAFLATKEFGILGSSLNQSTTYVEIHPEGPLSNDVFSIDVLNNNLWVVYGGYSATYTPTQKRQGFSHFNGENWINTKYTPNLPKDLVSVTIDPIEENKVFISASGITSDINSSPTGGVLVVENDVLTTIYNHLNSTLEPIVISLPSINIRTNGAVFDNQGNFWVTNYEVDKKIHKLSKNGQWKGIDLSSVQTNSSPGLNEIIVDKSNSLWVGTRRNGLYIYNENGDRKKSLTTSPNEGNLPDLNVRTLAVDASNRVWIGTKSGLVVYNNASGVFDDKNPEAKPIVVNANSDGFGDRLLGNQTINSIAVDGADNKWFGTDRGGVLYTNPNGQNTLANLSKKNSPLPSNRIAKIKVDNSTGKVFFATAKGIVAYNSKVAPFGETLGEVYAYPNPALRNHETITIDGRNGTHLPKGTNVKILDVAGNLVYETNVVEGQELQGGKVVWNKKNLAGNKVASGIYIVLLSNDDASETSVTKIAIVN